MAGANFSLADLIPEVDTFTDMDGDKHEIRSTRTFGAIEYAKLKRFQREIAASQETVNTTKVETLEDENLIVAAVNRQEDAMNEFIGMIIPKMPMDRIKAIELADKLSFMAWWNEQQPKNAPAKNAQTGKRSQQKRL